MGEWEKKVAARSDRVLGKGPKWWKRFVDNVIGVRKGSKEEFRRFIEIRTKKG